MDIERIYKGSYNGNMMGVYIGGWFVKVIYSININPEKRLISKFYVVSLVQSYNK